MDGDARRADSTGVLGQGGHGLQEEQLLAWALGAHRLQSLGLVAGNIAHDLNNLLMAILGRAELAVSQLPSGSPAADHLGHLTGAARRAAEVIHQLLLYSGRGRASSTRGAWTETLRELAPLVEVTASKRCRVVWEIGDRVPPIDADPIDLRHLLLNLVLNASEALGENGGTITIRSGVVPCDRALLDRLRPDTELPAGDYVFVEVSDTGPGMPPGVLARAGEPMFSTRGEGRGLGLTVVRSLAARFGGAVSLDSREGGGTTARVLLQPVRTAEAVPLPPLPVAEAPSPGRTGTILVADDEEAVRELLTLMLERAGFTVVTVDNGRRAVERVETEGDRYDLVLLDFTMPEMNGDDAFRAIRRLRPMLPVVVASGFGEQVAAEAMFAEGLDGFVHKPASSTQLVAAIRKALARRQAGPRA